MISIRYSDDVPDFILKAMNSDAMHRIDLIDMNCGMNYTSFPPFDHTLSYSRAQHSFGVACILWKFTKDPKQTLSGLFHDISTPVFSHVVDFLNGDYITQESTEENTSVFIRMDPILCDVLDELNLKVEDVDDYHRFVLADNPSPQLSADRLEYMLGNILNYGFSDEKTISDIYSDLIVSVNEKGEQELCFKNIDKAIEFTELALKCSYVFTSDADRYGMEYLARLLKKGINDNVITYDDLYTDEKIITRKLTNSSLHEQFKYFTSINRILHTEESSDLCYSVSAKKRYVDPYVAGKGRVTALSENMRKQIEMYRNLSFDYSMKGVIDG